MQVRLKIRTGFRLWSARVCRATQIEEMDKYGNCSILQTVYAILECTLEY